MRIIWIFFCWLIKISAGCELHDKTSIIVTKYSGEDVLLPCSCAELQTKPVLNMRWVKSPGASGLEIYPNTHKTFKGRIQISNKDSPGNLSLLISHLTKNDEGAYRCEGHGAYSYRDITLRVTDFYPVTPSTRWPTATTLHYQTTISKKKDLYPVSLATMWTTATTISKKKECIPSATAPLQLVRHPGKSVLLPCSCADPQASPDNLTWMTTSQALSPDGGWTSMFTTDATYSDRLRTFTRSSPGNLSLRILDLTQRDHGDYRCIINDQTGRRITLVVLEIKNSGELTYMSVGIAVVLLLLLGGLAVIFWKYTRWRTRQMGTDNIQRGGTNQQPDTVATATPTYAALQYGYSEQQMYSTIGPSTGNQANTGDYINV